MIRSVTSLADFKLEVFFSQWEFRARHHLTASDAQTMPLAELLALADPEQLSAWGALELGYRETYGSPAIRQAIAATYEGAEAADVLCFAGAQEGIACAVHALMQPGDHAVVVTPNYQAVESIALSIGSATGVPLDRDREWALDLEAVAAAITPATRLIAVNFPNNPTGAVCDHATFRGLAQLADDHGIVLLSDEVYRGIEVEPARTLVQAADLSPRAISLGVLSKAYGLPGLRVGWVVCRDHALLERMERRKHYGSICNPGPSEVLGTIALRAGEQILARNRERVRANLVAFDRFFAGHAGRFEWRHPQGGCVAFPRYLGAEGAERFCAELLADIGVLLLPPSVYDSEIAEPFSDRFRIGVGRDDPGPALAALDGWLATRG
jgi:aspartate/methionine/tyrosine aminotransferase